MASLATCFNDVGGGGGGVLRQTIGMTTAMAVAEAIPTKLVMSACGWSFSHRTELYNYCPGDPYLGSFYSSVPVMDDYDINCTVVSSADTDVSLEPMVMLYHSGHGPRGVVNYTLPSSPGFCRFRIKFFDHYRGESVRGGGSENASDVTDAVDPATLALNGQVVWTGNDTEATCATVVSGAFEPGDVLTLTGRWILALFWIELIPNGSPACEMTSAAASDCCGECPVIEWFLGEPGESCCAVCARHGDLQCSQTALRSVQSCAAVRQLQPAWTTLNTTASVDTCFDGNSRIHPSTRSQRSTGRQAVWYNSVEDTSQALCDWGAADQNVSEVAEAQRFCPCGEPGPEPLRRADGNLQCPLPSAPPTTNRPTLIPTAAPTAAPTMPPSSFCLTEGQPPVSAGDRQ